MSALGLLRGVLLCTHLIAIANRHASACAEALAQEVPPDRVAPILDVERLPEKTKDGRDISRSPAHHLQNVLRKRIARGEIPHPDTVGVSIAMLMRVAGKLAGLNEHDLGAWASLTYLSEECDASPSQIRAVHNYLVEHGHSLRLPRLKANDRKVGSAKRPLVVTRTTIRPVYAVTCEMVETLSEEQILDLIALHEKRPSAEDPTERHEGPARRGEQVDAPTADGDGRGDAAQRFVRELAHEHGCLVAPLAAISQFTGISLPTGSVEWVADEAVRAGIVDLDNVDYSHAADALNELLEDLERERRGAEAMGESPPKIRGGRAGIRALITSYLKGKLKWLKKNGDVYQARDDARAREEAHDALLTPEQRERRGLPPVIPHGQGAHLTAARAPESVEPARRIAPKEAPAPTPEEQAETQLRSRSALLGARIFAEADAAKKRELEAERADVERRLADLLEQGPPE